MRVCAKNVVRLFDQIYHFPLIASLRMCNYLEEKDKRNVIPSRYPAESEFSDGDVEFGNEKYK